MSPNTAQPTPDHGRQVVLDSRSRAVKIRDAVHSRLVEMARDDGDCDFARWLLLQVCEIFKDEINDQTAAVPLGMDGREYMAGWKDALATICGLSSLCLKGPLEDEGGPSPVDPPAEFGHSCGGAQNLYRDAFGTGWDEWWEGLDWGSEPLGGCCVVDINPSAFEDDGVEISSPPASQASSSLIDTPSNVSISDSVLRALFPRSSSAESSSSVTDSFPSGQAPSTPDSRQPPGAHSRELNKSDIIRGLDTNALLAHFERESRLSERRIAAELGRTSLLRQAIFQDRFFGRVPSFAGAPGGDDAESGEYGAADAADGINEPFLGEAQQVRAVRQVKTLFRHWRKAAAENQVEEEEEEWDEASGGGTGVTRRAEDSDDDGDGDDGLSSDSASSSHDAQPRLEGHGGDAPPPSPRSESVYSDDTLWPASSPDLDETSALMAPPMHHYYWPLVANGPFHTDTDNASHCYTRLDESGPSSE